MTDSNTKVDSRSSDTSQDDRGQLACHHRGECEIETKPKSKDKLGNEKCGSCFGKQLAQNSSSTESYRAQQGDFAAESISDGTANEAAKKLARAADDVECGLPTGRKDVFAFVDITTTAKSEWYFKEHSGRSVGWYLPEISSESRD